MKCKEEKAPNKRQTDYRNIQLYLKHTHEKNCLSSESGERDGGFASHRRPKFLSFSIR